MMKAVLISKNQLMFKTIEPLLAKNNIVLDQYETGAGGLQAISETRADLAFFEEKLTDMTGLQCLQKIIAIDPGIGCVIASHSSPEEFHETYEGYGVLMQFSLMPGQDEIEQLLCHLEKIEQLKR